MKTFCAGLLILLLALAGCAPNRAKNNEDMALNTGDYKTALTQYQAEAVQGNAAAEMKLGYMYSQGKGVVADPVEGLRWYQKAADDGNPSAIQYMAAYYMVPHDGQIDYASSFKWYKVCAEQGTAGCELVLSIYYENSLGVEQDHDQAVAWLNKFIASRYPVGDPLYFQQSRDNNLNGYAYAVQDAISLSGFRPVASAGAGIVYLNFNIQDGRAINVTVAKSSGNAAADAEAVDAMQRAHLPPLLPSLQGLDHLQISFNFGRSGGH